MLEENACSYPYDVANKVLVALYNLTPYLLVSAVEIQQPQYSAMAVFPVRTPFIYPSSVYPKCSKIGNRCDNNTLLWDTNMLKGTPGNVLRRRVKYSTQLPWHCCTSHTELSCFLKNFA